MLSNIFACIYVNPLPPCHLSHSPSEPSDYNATNVEFLFDGDTSRACARIPIIDDMSLEAVESFNVILSTADTRVSLEPQTTTVFISDNDSKSCNCML